MIVIYEGNDEVLIWPENLDDKYRREYFCDGDVFGDGRGEGDRHLEDYDRSLSNKDVQIRTKLRVDGDVKSASLRGTRDIVLAERTRVSEYYRAT